MQIVATLVEFGPLFSGDTGPAIDLILLYDSGGFVSLVNANVDVHVHRWDPRRKVPVGPIVTEGNASIINAVAGQATFDWNSASPIASVPLDSGWYYLQADVSFPSGTEQLSQRAIFEVLPV